MAVVFLVLGLVLVIWFGATLTLLGSAGGLHCSTASSPRAGHAMRAGRRLRVVRPPARRQAASLRGPVSALKGVGCSIRRVAVGAPAVVWRVVRSLLVALLVLALPLAPMRYIARTRRRYVRLTVAPYRGEAAEPEAIRAMLESFHQQLLVRWWRRIIAGQPGIALEVAMVPDREGDLSGRMSIVCPESLADAVAGTFSACYRDSRLLPGGELPTVSTVVRLKKKNNLVRALREIDDQSHKLMDSLLAQMTSLGGPAIVQFACIPTPALFDRYRRSRYAAFERRAESGHVLVNARVPGLRSYGLGQELEGGLRVLHRPLFFTDIRVAAASRGACVSIAGTLRGESAAENRLALRNVLLRTPVYLRRITVGLCNPLPGWRHGVISSVELAGMWHVPSPALKGARMARLATPRLLAPAEIARAPECGLMRDERGTVGILPEDKTDGLGLIGGQKTGKTSVLCRTVRADALDPTCAVIVLMPKPGDALKALSMVPKDRVVHYLDLEHPEFGINPLLAPGDPAMVADKIVEAFRDVNMEGDIRGSSDRYLRQSAQAAIGASRAGVVDGPPTLWHMYRMLMPAEDAFRERIVAALMPDPRFVDTVTFFGRELPGDLRDAASQTTAKLDAPRNKILRLLVESLDKVLRHPRQLSLDDIVRRREVLIVDGKMGTFGSDNTRVMLQFILNNLYGTLQRQQQLPEHERVRLALKVDEAHLVLNESFADALATLRSAGLEVVAAWQYGEQIQDPKIRAGMMSLLRQRCMFSMGEREDVREMSSIAMASYSDMIRSDPEERLNLRVTPDMIFNLPNHHAICSWISRGARAPAFLAQTFPLEANEDVVRHHLEAQQERGGNVPSQLPDPLPDADWRGLFELPAGAISMNGSNGAATIEVDERAEEGTTRHRAGGALALGNGSDGSTPATAKRRGNGSRPSNGSAPSVASPPTTESPPTTDSLPTLSSPEPGTGLDLDFDLTASSVHAPDRDEPPVPQAVPETYVELDLDEVRGLIWEKPAPPKAGRSIEPTERDLEILGALWSYRFLFANQIWRRWWGQTSQRSAQQGLQRMTQAGWVRRFKFQLGERGAQQRVYCLSKDGFELARGRVGRHGPYVDEEGTWREAQIGDPRRVLRELHVNGWVLALEQVAGRAMGRWRGPREGRVAPPRKKVRGEWVDIRPAELVLGTNHRLRDCPVERFEPVSPDATVELRIPTGGSRERLDVMIELDRGRSPAASEERLKRYDGFVSGWCRLLKRYQTLGTPPVVVFVSEDERACLSLLRLADRVLTTRVAKAGTQEVDWPSPGRRGIVFAVERDIHDGSLRALALPEHPPELRVRLEGPQGKTCRPRRVHVVEPRLLRRK